MTQELIVISNECVVIDSNSSLPVQSANRDRTKILLLDKFTQSFGSFYQLSFIESKGNYLDFIISHEGVCLNYSIGLFHTSSTLNDIEKLIDWLPEAWNKYIVSFCIPKKKQEVYTNYRLMNPQLIRPKTAACLEEIQKKLNYK